jgi:PAT family beta-lactamase induction signal transducer AmpG
LANLYLSENRTLRIVTLCAMYVGQGVPFGFVSVTLVAYLSGRGMGVDAIAAITAWSTLPWAFKWLWGPVIDRFGLPSMGRRRPWILLAQMLMAITLATMIAIPDMTSALRLLLAMVFVHNCFVALQDVSTDALAVDLLKEDERGRANGFMYASSYAGTLLGGAGMGWVMAKFGLRAALVLQVSILLSIMVLPLLLRERRGEKLLPWTKGRSIAPGAERAVRSTRDLFASLLRAFSLRASLLTAVIGLTCYVANAVLIAAATVYFIQDLGWTESEFTRVMGGYGVITGMLGAAIGGILADKLGPRKMIAISSILLGLGWIGFSFAEPLWEYKRAFLLPFTAVEAFVLGVFAVSFFALAMGVSWPKVAATQFTAYMAFMNVSRVIGSKCAPVIDKVLEFGAIYFAMGIFQIVIIAPLLFIDPHQTRRVLGVGDEPPERDGV